MYGFSPSKPIRKHGISADRALALPANNNGVWPLLGNAWPIASDSILRFQKILSALSAIALMGQQKYKMLDPGIPLSLAASTILQELKAKQVMSESEQMRTLTNLRSQLATNPEITNGLKEHIKKTLVKFQASPAPGGFRIQDGVGFLPVIRKFRANRTWACNRNDWQSPTPPSLASGSRSGCRDS